MVRERKAEKMPRTTGLNLEAALELEESNIVKCMRQAGDKYGFTPSLKPKAAGKKDEH